MTFLFGKTVLLIIERADRVTLNGMSQKILMLINNFESKEQYSIITSTLSFEVSFGKSTLHGNQFGLFNFSASCEFSPNYWQTFRSQFIKFRTEMFSISTNLWI